MGLKRPRADTISAPEPLDPSNPAPNTEGDVKIVHLDANAVLSSHTPVITCSLPPHKPWSFSSYEAYDVHYQKTHLHRCADCRRNFPDEHFLHLHIAENHDPISAARRERGEKNYACLVPTCPRACSTPFKRRLHCIDAHAFPRNYDFFVINTGIDRRSSMLRPPRSQSATGQVNSKSKSKSKGKSKGKSKEKEKEKENVRANGVVDGMDIEQQEQDPDSSTHVVEEMDTADDGNGDVDVKSANKPAPHVQRTPVKLHGRGGFGRRRAPNPPSQPGEPGGPTTAENQDSLLDGSGKEQGREQAKSKGKDDEADDPMEGLMSRMSALQFVPHSVRMARGRGGARGRGQG